MDLKKSLQQQQRKKIQEFQRSLPIHEYRARIQEIVENNNFCVITGDTGSGKSTQLPQYMVDSERIFNSIKKNFSLLEDNKKQPTRMNVIVTQPRRMAARSMAKRVAYERGVQVGDEVGYSIRFDDNISDKTVIQFITDGILIKKCIKDPYLFQYQVVILDQAHERSLNTDILFALVKKAVIYRKGTLKLIVTSATLNTKIFSSYFLNCPVVQMHGKLYPVEVKYFPIKQNSRVQQSVKAAIRMHLHEGPGDILVFLTGSEQCQSATRICQQKLQQLMNKGKQVPGMIIYQLYGALSNQDQIRIFQKTPEGIRKVVFCTNIAQTSLTIDNIGFVIDSGYFKQKNYNPKTNMDTLIILPISKIQAIQRKGRAGRTQPGKCLRLYTEKFYEQMKDYTLPEIFRVSLSSVVLTLKTMKINNVVNFQYIQSPEKQAIFKALGDLFLLGAINQKGQVQSLGFEMSKFPLQPQFSKAIITSRLFDNLQAMITLVSMLSTQSIFKRVLRINQQEYEQFLNSQTKFFAQTGDHQTLLNIFQGWIQAEDIDQFCDKNFLQFRALKQSGNIKEQLYKIAAEQIDIQNCKRCFQNDPNYKEFVQLKKHYGNVDNLPDEYTRSLLRRNLAMAFYYNTARLTNNQQAYLLNYPQGTVVSLDPTSSLARQNIISPCLLFTDLGMGNNGGIMRMVSIINPKWIQSYLKKTKELDFFKLSGIQVQRQLVIQPKIQQTQEVKKKRLEQERQRKIRQAKQRYQARKKIKKD